MTPLEKRLARRIHNRRARLRPLERFNGWQKEARIWSKSQWCEMASALLAENRKLRVLAGISGDFDQMAAMPTTTAIRAAFEADCEPLGRELEAIWDANIETLYEQ